MKNEDEITAFIKIKQVLGKDHGFDVVLIEGTLVHAIVNEETISPQYSFEAKIYYNLAKFNCDKAIVNKLKICEQKSYYNDSYNETKEIVDYDNGWKIRPRSKKAKEILEQILAYMPDMEKVEINSNANSKG